jgi:predicted kinase
MKQFIVIINGPSGVGKSTVSHILSGKFKKCVHVDIDLLCEFVPNNKGTAAEMRLAYKNAANVTSNFVRAGYRAIVDGVFPSGREIGFFISNLADRDVPVYLYTLSGDLAVIQMRYEEKRGTRSRGPTIRRQFSSISAHSRSLGLFINTTDLGIMETVNRVRRLVAGGEGRIAGRNRSA